MQSGRLWFHSINPVGFFRAACKSEESNDEIKAWREERRRNYPTRLNIQRKVMKNVEQAHGPGDVSMRGLGCSEEI